MPDLPAPPTCPACGGELIQKSRPRLLTVGAIFLLSALLPLLSARAWIPAIVGSLTGLYLLLWATVGRAQWCRQCKAFPRVK